MEPLPQSKSEDDILPSNIKEGNIDAFQKKEYLFKFAIDIWYSKLSEVTFPTTILPLSIAEGKSLSTAYRRITIDQNGSRLILLPKNPMLTIKDDSVDDSDTLEILQTLVARIDDEIRRFGSGGVFVKLNHRSPKDVVFDRSNPATLAAIEQRFANIRSEELLQKSGSAWILALNDAMCIKSGLDAIRLLCSSYRVKEDLSSDLEFPEFFKSKLILRKFEKIDPSLEFRAFVSKGKLTTISQYEASLHFPHLIRLENQIDSKLLLFWESVRGKFSELGLDSYVIDFCIIPPSHLLETNSVEKMTEKDLRDSVVKIVELNPFHANTSACGLSWKKDRERILNGPFIFWVNYSEPKKLEDCVTPLWSPLIEKMYSERKRYLQGSFFSVLALLSILSPLVLGALLG